MTKILYKEEEAVELSIKSADLLFLLLERRGQVVHFDQIKAHLWAASQEASDGALRVYIAQLKKYFPSQIENVRGVGYRMKFS